MLPYPSGTLHVGQVRNYTQGDVVARFQRRNGRRVMRPMGYDSFGLNAENAAIREGGHPRLIVEENIEGIREQMKRMGWAIDWDREVPVFTTRADTLFGATFFVLAPEHPLVPKLVQGTPEETEVLDYVRRSAARTFAEREEKEKDGVFTGRFATNPVNDSRLPIWVADYVLMEYGSGAVMAVPAHDERDYEFARRYDLPIKKVIVPADGSEPELPYAAKSE